MDIDYIAFAEHFPHPVFLFNTGKNEFIYVNPVFKSVFDISKDEIDVDKLRSKIPEQDQNYLAQKFNELTSGARLTNIDFRITVQQETRWLRANPVYIKTDKDEGLILGMAIDITTEVANQNIYNKFANKKNSILNIIAHDLRGPLGVAQMANSVLINQIEDPNLKKFTRTIGNATKQAIDLISDLLSREFVETADIVLNKKRLNIAVKLKEITDEYKLSENMSKRNFVFKSSAEDIYLNIDEPKFMQIINNLMTNALKFTHDDSTITIAVTDKSNSVLFSVADNGIGIPQKYHATLFEKYTDASRKGLNGEPSVGLGMSIVKTIVEWHKGNIWFESEEGKGTTVYFELPKD